MAQVSSINGRRMVTRAELAGRGLPLSTLKWLYRRRTSTRHPEAVNPGGKPLAWYEDEWTAWHARYRRTPGQGRRPGTPSRHMKAHPYAGNPRLNAVLGWLREPRELAARSVQNGLTQLGHPVSASVAARILTVARSVTAQDDTDLTGGSATT